LWSPKPCRSPILLLLLLLLLLMSAAVCDHVESHSVLLSNSVASRGKSGRVRTRKFLNCSILGLAILVCCTDIPLALVLN
jgi:hypothetical protein